MRKFSYSSAKKYYQYSPAKAEWLRANFEASQDMKIGTCLHTTLLGKGEPFKVYDPENRPEKDKTMGSKINREWKDRFMGDGIVITKADYDGILGVQKTVQNDPDLSLLLEGGKEMRLETDTLHGYLDNVNTKKHYITDCKKVQDISRFKWDANNFGYDIQAYVYKTMYQEIYGVEPEIFFIACELSAPYQCQGFLAGNDFIEEGRRKFCIAYDKFVYSQESGILNNVEPIITL